MNKYAFIENGTVIGVVETPKTIATSADVIDILGNDIEVGQTWDGTTFGPTPSPALRMRVSQREFRELFTMPEKQALYTAAKSNVDIEIFLDDLKAVEYVDLDFQQTIDSVNALETAGLIDPGRAAEILAGV